jgi:hypothetical protein
MILEPSPKYLPPPRPSPNAPLYQSRPLDLLNQPKRLVLAYWLQRFVPSKLAPMVSCSQFPPLRQADGRLRLGGSNAALDTRRTYVSCFIQGRHGEKWFRRFIAQMEQDRERFSEFFEYWDAAQNQVERRVQEIIAMDAMGDWPTSTIWSGLSVIVSCQRCPGVTSQFSIWT